MVRVTDTASILEAARQQISEAARGVQGAADSIDDSFLQAASLLRYCRGNVILTGAGTTAVVAQRSAHLLSVCGTPSFFIDAADALHGTLGAVGRDDVLIAMSKGGSTREVNEFARLARDKHARVIGVCSRPGAALLELADVPVMIPTNDGADPGRFIAMGSTLAYSAWLDAMTLVLMRSREYGWGEVFASHPLGAVGQIREHPEALPPLQIPQPAFTSGRDADRKRAGA